MAAKPDSSKPTLEAQLKSFLERFAPKDQKCFRSVRAGLRKRFPTANELAYNYTNQAVISYSPTEAAIEAIVAIALRTDGVRLYFSQGVKLPDPKGRLLGSAGQVRYVEMEAASQLAHPDLKALFAAAITKAKIPMPSEGRGKLIIRTDGTKPRTRRKTAK